MEDHAAHSAGDEHVPKPPDSTVITYAQVCPTCAGHYCLDCAELTAHDACIRRCPACVSDDVDWAQAWETSALITELVGLERLDRAIQTI